MKITQWQAETEQLKRDRAPKRPTWLRFANSVRTQLFLIDQWQDGRIFAGGKSAVTPVSPGNQQSLAAVAHYFPDLTCLSLYTHNLQNLPLQHGKAFFYLGQVSDDTYLFYLSHNLKAPSDDNLSYLVTSTSKNTEARIIEKARPTEQIALNLVFPTKGIFTRPRQIIRLASANLVLPWIWDRLEEWMKTPTEGKDWKHFYASFQNPNVTAWQAVCQTRVIFD